MNVRHLMAILHSFSIKNIFYEKMDLMFFYFRVTILVYFMCYVRIVVFRTFQTSKMECFAHSLMNLKNLLKKFQGVTQTYRVLLRSLYQACSSYLG